MADQTAYVEYSIRRKFNSLPKSLSTHCLYTVPEHVRKVNRECYQPSVVSIGPTYYKASFLKCSKELKVRHLECFIELGVHKYGRHAYTLANYIDMIRKWEPEARSYYEEQINLSSDEFVEMMMVDAAFVVLFFMLQSKSDLSLPTESILDPMEKKTAWIVKVEKDLFLEDNQLPFFVLNKLYDAFGQPDTHTHISFKNLTCNFIGITYIPGKDAALEVGRDKVNGKSHIKHLVDFLRICCLPPMRSSPDGHIPDKNEVSVNIFCLPFKRSHKHINQPNYNEESQFPLSAKDLKAAGVKFRATDSKNLLDIRYIDGVLQIPTLTIQGSTEAILRSIIFFEQCHYFYDSYFIDYTFFLNALIDTTEDVQILVQHGIIKHWLGSDEEVAIIMNRMNECTMIYTPNFYYSDISRKMNAHASTRWNKWKAILRRNYFSHPWSAISFGYLVLLLILTVLQVYTGFKG